MKKINVERLARVTLQRVQREAIARTLRQCRSNLSKERRNKVPLVEIAARWGCSTATASRWMNGKIPGDLRDADLRLRKLGSSLKAALPDEETIQIAVMEAAIRAALRARRIPQSEWQAYLPLRPKSIEIIRWVVKTRPIPDPFLADAATLERWFGETVAFVNARRDDVTRMPAAERQPFCAFAANAALDWSIAEECIRHAFPLQIAAFIVFYLPVDGIAGANSAESEAASRVMQDRIKRFYKYAEEIERVHAEIDDLPLKADSTRASLVMELARLERLRGRFSDGIKHLEIVASQCLSTFPLPGRRQFIEELRSELNECLAVHADVQEDIYLNANDTYQQTLRSLKQRGLWSLMRALESESVIESILRGDVIYVPGGSLVNGEDGQAARRTVHGSGE